MLIEKASQTLTVGESLMLSGIGILVVFLELIILALLILGLSKLISRMAERKIAGQQPAQAAPAAPAPVEAPAPKAALPAVVELVGVEEPTAAVIMALVADQSGIPLERLAFRSIRKID